MYLLRVFRVYSTIFFFFIFLDSCFCLVISKLANYFNHFSIPNNNNEDWINIYLTLGPDFPFYITTFSENWSARFSILYDDFPKDFQRLSFSSNNNISWMQFETVKFEIQRWGQIEWIDFVFDHSQYTLRRSTYPLFFKRRNYYV